MEFKKVALIGVGAVGSYILWGLSQKDGIDLCVIAEGERKDRYERDGFEINGNTFHPAIKTPSEAHGADLIIVATKYSGLSAAVGYAAVICDEHTQVISLMNGVESEGVIGEKVGMEKMIYSVIKIASERIGNSVKFDPETTIGVIYGELEGKRVPGRLNAVEELFNGSGVKSRRSDVILSEIWCKFRLNVSHNLPQAILGVGVGAYLDSEHAAFLRDSLAREVEALAMAQGIDVSLADKSSNKGSAVAKAAKYSTYQDICAKRHTEIDMLAGAMIRIGEKLGIPTPYSQFVYHAIKALEEKNDGLFNY